MRYISRSSIDDYNECRRKWYWRYVYGGKGLDARKPNRDLLIGLGVHYGMESLLTNEDPEKAISFALLSYDAMIAPWFHEQDQLLQFQLTEGYQLVEGLLRGWIRTQWAKFKEEWEVLSVEEEERVLLAPFLTLMARADAVARERSSGRVFVFNWKTTSRKDDWNAKWRNDIQSWTEALASEKKHDVVAGVIYEGFYKGGKSGKVTASPLIYGWNRLNEGKREIRADYKAGWTRFAAAEEEGGLKWWVEEFLPLEVVEQQFLRSIPILKNDEVVGDWLEQVVARETTAQHLIEQGSERDREIEFYQVWGQHCNWCLFRDVCHKAATLTGMMEGGILVERRDHHLQEGEQ